MIKTDPDTQKLLSEFETMRAIEQNAHDFYVNALQNPGIEDEKIRDSFRKIAEDEKHHVELVERIINIIKNCHMSVS